jgi:hypothetical protein
VCFLIFAECWWLLWRLVCHPFPLSAFMPLLISAGCQQLLWEICLSAYPYSQPLLLYMCVTESLVLRVQLLAPPPFSRAGSAFHPCLPLLVLDYSLLFMFFSFSGGGGQFSLLRGCAGLFSWEGVCGSRILCVMLTCSFCSFMQEALEPAGGEKWQCSIGKLSTH